MQHKIVIEPGKRLRFLDFAELKEYRDLFIFLVWRSVKVRYAQSTLGVGWAIVQPLFSMLVFTVVFGNLAKIDSNGVPYAIFSFAGLVPWTYFSNALTESTGSLVVNAHMMSKVYFPRVVLPLSGVLAKLVDFCIAMVLLGVMLIFFGVMPNWGVLALPLLVLIMMMTAAGMGMWLTAMAIQYRDVQYAMGFLVQLLMYCAPVVYPTSLIPEQYRLLYALNPMAGVIEGFRSALLGTIPMPWGWVFIGFVTSSIMLISGIFYFRSKERVFADVA